MQNIPRKILVGVAVGSDFEPVAVDRPVIAQALWLAEKVGATVRFVHVIEWLEPDIPTLEPVRDETAARASKAMQPLLELAEAHGVTAEIVVHTGKTWYELLHEAWVWPADLVMIGPRVHRPGLLSRLTHGSTARRLLRKSPAPVWVVHPGVTVGVHRLLVAADLSAITPELIEAANAFHALTGCARHLLHCLDFRDDIALHLYADSRAALTSYHQQLAEQAEARIEELLGDQRSQWTVELGQAWVVRVLPEIVQQHQIDTVLVGGVQPGGLAGKLLGTTAEKIVENCDVSTVMYKPRDWASPVVFGR